MLRRDELLPIVDRIGPEVRPRVANVVAENVLLEIRFCVRRMHSAQSIEAREQRILCIGAAAIHARITTSARDGVRLRRCHTIDELAERVDYDGPHCMQASVAPSIRARPSSVSTHERFCHGGS